MRRGVAGVRLCDFAPCAERWPCARCGTRRVDQSHVAQDVDGYEVMHFASHVDTPPLYDFMACKECGHVLCSCLRPGWFELGYRNACARVSGPWTAHAWRMRLRPGWAWCILGVPGGHGEGATRAIAMAGADHAIEVIAAGPTCPVCAARLERFDESGRPICSTCIAEVKDGRHIVWGLR